VERCREAQAAVHPCPPATALRKGADPSSAGARGLGTWYAAAALRTAVAEVAHHLRREAVARGVPAIERTYRGYTCTLAGSYLDIIGQHATRPDVFANESYAASQALGERFAAPAGLAPSTTACGT